MGYTTSTILEPELLYCDSIDCSSFFVYYFFGDGTA